MMKTDLSQSVINQTERKICQLIGQEMKRLYPSLIERTLPEAVDKNKNLFFAQKSALKYVWLRAFSEPLSHADIDNLLYKEIDVIRDKVSRLASSGASVQLFFMFPGMKRGVLQSLNRFPNNCRFFEYHISDSSAGESLDLKEHPEDRILSPEQEIAEPILLAEETRTPEFRQAVLSREELNELIEIALSLKQMSKT